MKRWNGWGDESVDFPLPAPAGRFLEQRLGAGSPQPDAALEQVLSSVPPTRLKSHPLISIEAADRLRHARGHSLPDWVALRSGRIGAYPDGVALPRSTAEVREILALAAGWGARVIPYGGGTSVVGHINAPSGDAPVLTVSLARMNGLLRIDESSHLATFGAGVTGPDLEAHLRAHGFTLGHFPQSFEYSTLGGWIATRSSGQQSLGYGRIEDLFAGGCLESPAGELVMRHHPASAAGPDLRHAVLGSEGRLGILAEATVRIRPLPQQESYHAVFLPDWDRARDASRLIVQAHLPLTMMRLSTPLETETTLILAGHARLIHALERLLAFRGAKEQKCMLLLGFGGRSTVVRLARREALAIAAAHGGVHVGRTFGAQWHKNRFRAPYLRNALWDAGYAVDTLETATDWTAAPKLLSAIETALHQSLGDVGEQVHVFTHFSHLYPDGTSIYTTYVFRLASDPEETLRRWGVLKRSACRAIVANGGTISHQHGVGTDHREYLSEEKGALGIASIRNLCATFDPHSIMNPGKLV